jgi:hypothetical protein
MDANDESGKPANGAGAAEGLPQIESPELAPGQGEKAVEHRVTTAVALFRSENIDDDFQERPDGRLRALFATLQNSTLVAAIALTLGVGAVAGAVSSFGIGQALNASDQAQASEGDSVKTVLTQLSADIAALKAAQDVAAKNASGQLARVSERLDRAERAQAEPAAKLAKLSDSVDRLERRLAAAGSAPATTAAATAPATSVHPINQPEVTGSVKTPPAIVTPAKDLSRLPVVQGWVLHKVVDGTAVIHSREGVMEVGVGDKLPGGGRVESIRRQDGRWIVVTSRGLVVMR